MAQIATETNRLQSRQDELMLPLKDNRTIPPKETTIGIIGGGQLARMSAQAAQSMGYQVVILDSDPTSPAAQVTPYRLPYAWNSPEGTLSLAQHSGVITLENEWVAPDELRKAEDAGCRVVPSAATLEYVGDKLLQRRQFAKFDLASPRFLELSTWDDARKAVKDFGLPLVVKSRRGGYDGYGVTIVRDGTDEEWEPLLGLDPKAWYVEEFVEFDIELAVMVARSPSGEIAVYPVVESRQTVDGHRCDLVIAPAPRISPQTHQLATDLALKAVEAVQGTGLFGVELFGVDGAIYLNEIAPRPHNSGHYTMDGCKTSQFEQHIRAINDLPLGPTGLQAPYVVMVNLLAPRDGSVNLARSVSAALAECPDIHVHWYGKDELRTGRKMGHLNLVGESWTETVQRAELARAAFWGLSE